MRRRSSLAGQFLVIQLCVVLLAVIAVAATSLAGADKAFRTEQGQRLRSAAENLASQAVVREALANLADSEYQRSASSRAETTRVVYGAQFVLIANTRALVHADTQGIAGTPVPLGESDVLAGRSWVGVIDDDGAHLVAYVPVLDPEHGEIIGFVVVGVDYPALIELFRAAVPNLLVYLLLGAAVGGIGSLLLARRVKRQTMGLEPGEIAGLVEHREAMLHGIKEGVIGLDAAERVTLVNDEAVRLLGLPEHPVGRSLETLPLDTAVLDVLTGRVAGDDQIVLRGDRVLVLNRMPVRVRDRDVGSVTTLRDRTELTALRRELDVSRHTTDTLRAQAHDFTNRLHTIAGLVELGEYDEVVRYVNRATQLREHITRNVAAVITEPSLAAMLIAKSSLAAEQGVQLRIAPESALDTVDDALATDLVTVVGNLVNNAIDALQPGGWVEVGVRAIDGEVVVTVRDSGAGVAAELAEEVFRQGFTTKAGGGHRGLGLALTRLICTRRGGGIEVSGSTFTARFPLTATPAGIDRHEAVTA
jgi:sensor histidine kinase regulating citrate/malate metabolism